MKFSPSKALFTQASGSTFRPRSGENPFVIALKPTVSGYCVLMLPPSKKVLAVNCSGRLEWIREIEAFCADHRYTEAARNVVFSHKSAKCPYGGAVHERDVTGIAGRRIVFVIDRADIKIFAEPPEYPFHAERPQLAWSHRHQ